MGFGPPQGRAIRAHTSRQLNQGMYGSPETVFQKKPKHVAVINQQERNNNSSACWGGDAAVGCKGKLWLMLALFDGGGRCGW